MSSHALPHEAAREYPVQVHVEQQLLDRNRLTTAFRIFLAIPHLLLVGGPLAFFFSWSSTSQGGMRWDLGTGGALGAVAAVCAVISWFAILFTRRHPAGLWSLSAYYLRWRVRAVAYTALLRDEYPPFGDGAYPVRLELPRPTHPRDLLTVVFRILLAVPHILAVWVLGIGWALTTVVAWFAILFTGDYPARLYDFGVGVLRWSTRLEAYILLLRDEYPPFTLA